MDGFMRAEDVAKELGVSMSYAYRVVRELNKELNNQGYMTIAGRVSKTYFNEKLCYQKKTN